MRLRTAPKGFHLAVGMVMASAALAPAHAQSERSTLVEVAVPDSFDRGRNESVNEHPRPDYQQLGIQLGSFKLFPTIEAGVGVSDNVYQTNGNKRSDGFGYVKPAFLATSDWSRNHVEIAGGGNFKRYLSETPRNLTLFNGRALGRLDFGAVFSLTGEASYERNYESAQSGAIDANLGAFSTYDRSLLSLRGEFSRGQARAVVAYDHTGLTFQTITNALTGTVDQSTRDRVVDRGTVRVEYAFTPSVAVYTQGNLEATNYSKPVVALGGNRDSTSGQGLVGLSLDLAGLLRGKIGVGYAFRDYRLPIFRDVKALSAEAKIEFFPTELTTFTLTAGRTIEDTAIGSTSAYYNNKVSGRVDHELLRNLLLHGLAEFAWQDYLDFALRARNMRLALGAEYLSSHKLKLLSNINMFHRKDNGTGISNNFYEYSADVGAVWQF